MYSKRRKKISQLLELLAEKSRVYQQDMDKLLRSEPRTIIRQLQLLESLGLAKPKVEGHRAEKKPGRRRQFWEPTFQGIVQALKSSQKYLVKEEEYLHAVAEAHKDKWLIFKEWTYLSKDENIRRLVVDGIGGFVAHASAIVDYSQAARFTEPLRKFEVLDAWNENRDRQIEREFTNAALWLNTTLDMTVSRDLPVARYPSDTDVELLPFVAVPKYAMKNENLREYIEEEFRLESRKHRLIERFKKEVLGC